MFNMLCVCMCVCAYVFAFFFMPINLKILNAIPYALAMKPSKYGMTGIAMDSDISLIEWESNIDWMGSEMMRVYILYRI